MFRPNAMRVDRARCIDCELCWLIAPVIRENPDRIPVTGDTLEAMAVCPGGAIVWCEGEASDPAGPSAREDTVD